jgi:hypothetical protein
MEKKKECDTDEGKVFSVNNDQRRRLVFAKLVSLTQTFDSLGSINAPRHVASKKEQARGDRRDRIWYPSHETRGKRKKKGAMVKRTTRINYEAARRVSISRVNISGTLHPRATVKSMKGRSIEPGNGDRRKMKWRYFSGTATKNCLPQNQSCRFVNSYSCIR